MILTIILPNEGKILLKPGQKVDFSTPLYQEKLAEEIKIYLAQSLKVAPDKIFHHLKKFVGDEIKKGDLVAEKKSFFDSKKILSEAEGILKEIDHNEGSILLQLKNTENKTKCCFFKGEIASIEKKEIKIKVDNLKDYLLKEINHLDDGYLGGEVYYFNEKNTGFNEEDIRKKLIFVSQTTAYSQAKLEALGANGFILLHELSGLTPLPSVKFKNVDDFKKASNLKLPYCVVDKRESKIIFYC